MAESILKILNYLYQVRGCDFTNNNPEFIEQGISRRIFETKTDDHNNYLNYIIDDQNELENLIDVLTINVSAFFRNPLTYEYLSSILLPALINNRKENNVFALRIWSAGCSTGEEPYTMAIILNEALKNENRDFDIKIFASDIDRNALDAARTGVYDIESTGEVKV